MANRIGTQRECLHAGSAILMSLTLEHRLYQWSYRVSSCWIHSQYITDYEVIVCLGLYLSQVWSWTVVDRRSPSFGKPRHCSHLWSPSPAFPDHACTTLWGRLCLRSRTEVNTNAYKFTELIRDAFTCLLDCHHEKGALAYVLIFASECSLLPEWRKSLTFLRINFTIEIGCHSMDSNFAL